MACSTSNVHITGLISAFGIISSFIQRLLDVKCTNHPRNRKPILQPQGEREKNILLYFLTAFISKQDVRHLSV